MRLTHRILVAAALLAAVVATSAAQNVVGNWKGKIVMDMSKMPKVTDPNQKKMMDAAMGMVKKMTLNLTMKSNKTYTMVVVGAPAGMGAAKGNQTSEGTWKQSGNQVTMTSVKDNGKPARDKTPQKLTVSKDGRTMTLVLPTGGGPSGKVVFTR